LLRAWPAAVVVGATVLRPGGAAAHALGQRYDLPLPLSYYVVGGGLVVLLTFVVMAVFVARPHDGNMTYSMRLAAWPVDAASRRIFLAIVEILSVLAFLFLLFAGFFGFQRNPNLNILPVSIWILWWVGLAFISALIGNLWDAINPWAAIGRWASGLLGLLAPWPKKPLLAYPKWLAAWPAFILFAGFAWMEVAWPARIVPAELATAILIYSAITWAGMAVFGRRAWLDNAEAFSLFFGTFARFAVLAGRTRDGISEIVLRAPSVGLLDRPPLSFSRLAFILLIFSTVTFDGISETPFWQDIADWLARQDAVWPILLELSYILPGTAGVNLTLGLMCVFSTFLIVYLVFSLLIDAASGHGRGMGQAAKLFVYSLVPIAIAYHLAHFLSFLLIFGQSIIPLISNPLGTGTDFFGTADYKVNIGLIGPKFAWFSAALAIVIGHIAAVFLAHAQALRHYPNHRSALRSQIPMLVLMVTYTMFSLWILAQPVVK
ncbi:MAG: hypothetical protein O7C63_07265, partial [Alphaproteobacteria bacterium]|nr:hypothetical protein [Alphaproteobacteria bacterium]